MSETRISGERWHVPYLYVLPMLVLLTGIITYPLFYAVGLAFTDHNPLFPVTSFIGLRNFGELFQEEVFTNALFRTIIWTVGVVTAEFILGLITALLLNEKFPGRIICRALVLFPWVVPWVVAGILWRSIFHPSLGFLNYVLRALGFIEEGISWLGPDYALVALMIMMIWKLIPFMTVILLAGLGSIPPELYEAARIDGANPWQSLTRITLPLIAPISGIAVLLSSIWMFRHFDIVQAITQGGPVNATMLLSVMSYQNAFRFYRMGYGSAIGVFMFVVLLIPVYFYIRNALQRR